MTACEIWREGGFEKFIRIAGKIGLSSDNSNSPTRMLNYDKLIIQPCHWRMGCVRVSIYISRIIEKQKSKWQTKSHHKTNGLIEQNCTDQTKTNPLLLAKGKSFNQDRWEYLRFWQTSKTRINLGHISHIFQLVSIPFCSSYIFVLELNIQNPEKPQEMVWYLSDFATIQEGFDQRCLMRRSD